MHNIVSEFNFAVIDLEIKGGQATEGYFIFNYVTRGKYPWITHHAKRYIGMRRLKFPELVLIKCILTNSLWYKTSAQIMFWEEQIFLGKSFLCICCD